LLLIWSRIYLRYLNRRPTGQSVRKGTGAAMVIQGVRQPSTVDLIININGHFVELEINIFLMTGKPSFVIYLY
jgi:hypothetical protein